MDSLTAAPRRELLRKLLTDDSFWRRIIIVSGSIAQGHLTFFFLVVLKVEKSKVKGRADLEFARAVFLVYRCHLLAVSSHGARHVGAYWSLLYKGMNSIYEGSAFNT